MIYEKFFKNLWRTTCVDFCWLRWDKLSFSNW